ncbi:MAG: glycosyltransferase family 39 protein [Pleurocapsa sp.]
MNTIASKSLANKINFSYWQQFIPIGLILLLAAGLYFYQLGTEGFWIDELTSMTDIKSGRGLSLNNTDIRPLYYILLSIWAKFSHNDAWLRSLSVLFALGSVLLVYQIGRRLVGEPEGLISALLLALSPLFINHAQEVRMYTLSACLGLGGTLALTQALTIKKPKHPTFASMAWWAGMRFLAIITVPLNFTLLVADIIIIWLRFHDQRRVLLNFGKWLLAIGIFWSPCVFSVFQAASPTSDYANSGHVASRQAPGLINVVRILKFYTVWPFAVGENAIAAKFYQLFTGLLAGLLGAALIQKYRSAKLLWVGIWAFVPLIQIFIFSHISMSLWVNRYLLFVCPYIFILLAAGFMRVWRKWRIMAIVVALVYTLAISGGLVRYYTVLDRPTYNSVIQTISNGEQPGDLIVWSMYYTKALEHYYHGSAPIHWLPFTKRATESELEAWLVSLPPIKSRFWLACELSSRSSQILQNVVQQKFQIEEYQAFAKSPGTKNHMEVLLLTPNDTNTQKS